MTYFHMRTHTIIGAKPFHCPVRDGKEWGRLAMVVRQTVAGEWARVQDAALKPNARPAHSEEVKGFDRSARGARSGSGFTLPPSRFPLLLFRNSML